MFTFSVVKKLGEGNYLSEGRFIIERVRRENALNMHTFKRDDNKSKAKSIKKNGKQKPS
ncbi:MAG: hypothetical protein HQ549_05940 [Candidatus Omnitrophica bacterium]|nr:hypothetical protein [Candidatus Omnitrophota bacterium]